MKSWIVKTKDDWFKINALVQDFFAKNTGKDFEVTLNTNYKLEAEKTTPQLRYLHGEVMRCLKLAYELQDGMTYTKEATKLRLKHETGYGEWHEFILRGIPIKQFVPRSYADAKIADIMHAIDKAKEICLAFGIVIPEPVDFKLGGL